MGSQPSAMPTLVSVMGKLSLLLRLSVLRTAAETTTCSSPGLRVGVRVRVRAMGAGENEREGVGGGDGDGDGDG